MISCELKIQHLETWLMVLLCYCQWKKVFHNIWMILFLLFHFLIHKLINIWFHPLIFSPSLALSLMWSVDLISAIQETWPTIKTYLQSFHHIWTFDVLPVLLNTAVVVSEEARVGNTEVKREPINPMKFQLNFDWPTFFIPYISSWISPISQLSTFIVIIITKNCPSAFLNAGEKTLVFWYIKSICQSAKWLWVTPIDRARRPNWLLVHYVAKEMVSPGSYIR